MVKKWSGFRGVAFHLGEGSMRYLVAVALILLSSGPAWAQSRNAVQEILNVQDEMAGIDREVSGLHTKLVELGPIQRGREEEYKQLKAQHDSIQQDHNQRARAFNSRRRRSA